MSDELRGCAHRSHRAHPRTDRRDAATELECQRWARSEGCHAKHSGAARHVAAAPAVQQSRLPTSGAPIVRICRQKGKGIPRPSPAPRTPRASWHRHGADTNLEICNACLSGSDRKHRRAAWATFTWDDAAALPTAAAGRGASVAVRGPAQHGEGAVNSGTVVLLPPLILVGVSIRIARGCQHFNSAGKFPGAPDPGKPP